MRDLRASRDHLGDWSGGSILRSNEVNLRVNLRSYLGVILRNLQNCLHLAVGRALRLNIVYMGPWDGWLGGSRYSPPCHPPTSPPPRVHPSHYPLYEDGSARCPGY